MRRGTITMCITKWSRKMKAMRVGATEAQILTNLCFMTWKAAISRTLLIHLPQTILLRIGSKWLEITGTFLPLCPNRTQISTQMPQRTMTSRSSSFKAKAPSFPNMSSTVVQWWSRHPWGPLLNSKKYTTRWGSTGERCTVKAWFSNRRSCKWTTSKT